MNGAPEDIVQRRHELFTVRDGHNSQVMQGVERVLGRPPRNFADSVRTTAATGVWSVLGGAIAWLIIQWSGTGRGSFETFVFQPNQSSGLDAVFHFIFAGAEEHEATITIRNRTIDVKTACLGGRISESPPTPRLGLASLRAKRVCHWP